MSLPAALPQCADTAEVLPARCGVSAHCSLADTGAEQPPWRSGDITARSCMKGADAALFRPQPRWHACPVRLETSALACQCLESGHGPTGMPAPHNMYKAELPVNETFHMGGKVCRL
eukprot:365580-Chlamydomonas_euryale.AAC.10